MRTRRRLHRRPADGAVAAGDALEIGAVDDALAPALRLRVNRGLARPAPDPRLAGGDGDGDPLADPSPRNGVALASTSTAQSFLTMRVSSRNTPNDGLPASGFNRCASSRSKRAMGASSVAP